MEFCITHLTRMQEGYICVAGVDLATRRHIRPVLGHRLSDNYLRCHGGPFDMALVVDLGEVTPTPLRPRMEDCIFKPDAVKLMRCLNRREFWELLTGMARPHLQELFGDDLTYRGSQSAAVDVGAGEASLGCLTPKGRPRLYLRQREGKPPSVRLEVSDGPFHLDLGVTDIRLYAPDHITPDTDTIHNVADRLAAAVKSIVCVGLGYPPPPKPGAPTAVHWLQVNSIHLEDRPIWPLGR